MTHTQTQGADGAGTMTAGADWPTDEMVAAGYRAYAEHEWDAGRAKRGPERDGLRIAFRAMMAATPRDTTTPAPAATPGVPDSLRAPDDMTREQIRGRAKALLVKNGWMPGDNFTTQNVVELMATIGMSLLADQPQDRCAHPECGCDADSVCGATLAARPEAPSDAGKGRSIDTAPKDRSEILLFGTLARSRGKPSWFIGAWFPTGEHGDGWWVSSCVEVIATEWAPMPAPPASSGQEGV